MLSISNLDVSISNKLIIKGLSLRIKPGETHALLGPNGSGKSSLALTLVGHPEYKIKNKKAKIKINKKNLTNLSPDQRAKAGLFLAFQNPISLDGVSILPFLRNSYKQLYPTDDMALYEFRQLVEKEAKNIGLNLALLNRNVNEGFSGGERKRLEMLQLRLLKPQFAIIDEIDSGLDIDGLKAVAGAITASVKDWQMGCLVITHHQKLLQYLKPTQIHVMAGGKIVATGENELLHKIEKEGYKHFNVK